MKEDDNVEEVRKWLYEIEELKQQEYESTDFTFIRESTNKRECLEKMVNKSLKYIFKK